MGLERGLCGFSWKKGRGSIVISSGLENGALPRKLFLYLSRVFTNASSHLFPLFSTCVVSADFLSPNHSLAAEGYDFSLETVSLLKEQAEVDLVIFSIQRDGNGFFPGHHCF